MINPAKLIKMQHEAKQMKKKMQERKVVGESKDGMVKVYMNLAQEFEDIYIADEYLSTGSLEVIKKGMKEAYKDYEKKMQKEMVKDIDMDQIKRMLG